MSPAKAGSKRQDIIDTAYVLFKRDGYHATGIDRIIAEANVAKMTMYRNFPSKEGLIVAVLNHRARLADGQLDRLVVEASTPEAKVDAIFSYYSDWFGRHDFHGCLFAHALAEFDDAGDAVHEAAAAQKNGFRDRLRRVLADVMPDERAEAVATALFMLLEGATLLAQMGRGAEAMHSARWAAARLITSEATGG